MRGEYQKVYDLLQKAIAPHGFVANSHDEFYASFTKPDGWTIAIEGDRVAYPGFNLLLIKESSESPKSIYSVEELMLHDFAARLPNEKRSPSLANRIEFLSQYLPEIMSSLSVV